MLAIYKRELSSHLKSVIGFLFMAIVTFFTGLYFIIYNVYNGYTDLSYALGSATFIFIVAVPILTMRILAEERKNKTDQLILTSPVSVGKIVVGKYLALETVFALTTLIICVYPLVLTRFGTVLLGQSYVAILGYFLYGSAAIAIGVFLSSITESQVIAAVLSVLVLFITYVMSTIEYMISADGNLITKALGYFDLATPFQNMISGQLDLTAILYYLTLILLFLFLTTQSIQKRRYHVSVKNLKMGAYSVASIVLAIAVFFAANLFAQEVPDDYTMVDITSNKLYTMTDETKTFLETMDKDVTIYVINKESQEDTVTAALLEKYAGENDHISIEYVDPTVNPQFASQYTDSRVSMGTLIVVCGDKTKVVNASDLYATEIDYSTYQSTETGYDGEGQITAAIAYVTSDDLPKVYLTDGHGEITTLDSTFTDALSKANIDYSTVTLLQEDSVPEDADYLFINGPSADFNSDDADKVITYVENGGSLLITLNASYSSTDMPNLDRILAYYGVSQVDGVVVEQGEANYYQNPLYLLPNIASADVTSSVYGNYLFMPYAVGLAYEASDDVEVTELLYTSDSAFSRVDIETNQSVEMSDTDIAGPFSLALRAEKTLDSGSSVLYVYGSSELFTMSTDSMVSGYNLKLFSDTVADLTPEGDTVSVSVPVKYYESDYLTYSNSAIGILIAVFMVAVPFVLLALGLIIWIRRRKK